MWLINFLRVGGSQRLEDDSLMKNLLTACACSAVVILMFTSFAPSPAHAGRILYSVSRDDDFLRVVDPSTGHTISSVPITLAGKVVSFGNGLATNPVTGQLFGTDIRTAACLADLQQPGHGRINQYVDVSARGHQLNS